MSIESLMEYDFLSISQIMKGIICFFIIYVIYKFLQVNITCSMAYKEHKIINEEKLYSNSKKQIVKYMGFTFFIIISIIFTNINEFISVKNQAINNKTDDYLDVILTRSEDKMKWLEFSSSLKTLKEYKYMSIDERMEVMKSIVDYELDYLGVDENISLIYEKYDDNKGGYYSDGDKLISINENNIENPDYLKEVIMTVLHECYHAYQYECVRDINDSNYKAYNYNLRDYKKILIWKYEFENYCDSKMNYDDYINQGVESEAEMYKMFAILKYEEYID
ncbi:MAG: hypothetical protein IJA34_13105 [Lachnospiraceae bacterium]|nr:hypothetical protein [Lachnospiraceae bacterium]